ncbi:MAG: putative Gamma-glutamyltranspeptidase [Alphaproteobacteria bacterium]|nr:putative Gamma-glutamyltranspeptidase [Alphaproteobacteria bacterium]
MASAATCLALLACGDSNPPEGKLGQVEGFYGGVVSDSPRAAEIGRDILAVGGNAVDAAVATYFAMAATLPSSASLGGGGACLVHNSKARKTEALSFLTKVPAASATNAGGVPVGVPGNARGMAALHARYGAVRWEELVAPGERLARLGTIAPRALIADLQVAASAIQQDATTRRAFSTADGRLLREGDPWVQEDLAGTLGNIRLRGAGELYTGPLARNYVQAVRGAGGQLSMEDMRDQIPIWSQPITVKWGNHQVYFAAPPAGGGLLSAQMWSLLESRDAYQNANEQNYPHVIAEMSKRAYTERSHWLDQGDNFVGDPAAMLSRTQIDTLLSSYRADQATPVGALPRPPQPRPNDAPASVLVTVDRFANAVACAFTTNGFFGGARVAGSTGVLIAPAPGVNGRGAAALGPMLVANVNTGDFFFAGAASGGTSGPAVLTQVAANAMLLKRQLSQAMSMPRVLHPGLPDRTFAEPAAAAVLRARGHVVEELPALGQVSAIFCSQGLHEQRNSCSVANDPRGNGLALSAPASR